MDEEAREALQRAGRIGKEALEWGLARIDEGVRLLDVAEGVEGRIVEAGALPGFPANISRDRVAAHFTPQHGEDDLVFQRGNLVKLDVGVHLDGYIADNARTVEVGTRNWTDLIRASEEALEVAVEVMRPGTPLRMVGAAIERTIRAHGYRPVENLSGHKVDRYVLHSDKSVPNVEHLRGDREPQTVEAGEVYAIEPFASTGDGRVSGGSPSNIYRVVEHRTSGAEGADALLEKVYADFRTLPFSQRWCHRYDDRPTKALRTLLRKRVVMSYPQLVETAPGMVSQSEDTVIVGADGARVTTAH